MYLSKIKLRPMQLKSPDSDEAVYRKEWGHMGEVYDPHVQWFLYWLKLRGEGYVWMWHRARLEWCKRDDVGWVPMAMAECADFKFGDHVWHGPFTEPLSDVTDALPCEQCIEKHNALLRAQREN